MKALIDGDIIQYRCGFASDKQKYVAPDGHKEQYKKDIVAHCNAQGFHVDDVKTEVTYEPVEHCLHSVKLVIKGIMESIDATEAQIFLTGKANFRDDLYGKYKANRDRSRKPHHYEAIGEYLVKYWGAEVVTGVEADDAMGWWQWKEILRAPDLASTETCICTLDKDLNMIPGYHFNWVADEGKGLMYLSTTKRTPSCTSCSSGSLVTVLTTYRDSRR
jgi:5'-3' exonuclease